MSVRENVSSNVLVKYLDKAVSSQIVWILTFSFLTILAAQVAVPAEPVPFTLQTMLVLLAGAFLGSKNGAYSQIIYLLLGVIGLPVFAQGFGGFAVLFGPTGGYLLSFPFAAYIVGLLLEKRRNFIVISVSMVIGSLIVLLIGSSYLSLFFNGNFEKALFSGALIFTPWDLIKIGAAASIYFTLSKKYSRLPK